MTDKKIKVEFAPGAFDQFEGTQEELEELIAEIQRMAESGELAENARPVDLDDDDDLELVSKVFEDELEHAKRKLQ